MSADHRFRARPTGCVDRAARRRGRADRGRGARRGSSATGCDRAGPSGPARKSRPPFSARRAVRGEWRAWRGRGGGRGGSCLGGCSRRERGLSSRQPGAPASPRPVNFNPLDLRRLDTLPQQFPRGAAPCGKRRFDRNAFHADAPWMRARKSVHPCGQKYCMDIQYAPKRPRPDQVASQRSNAPAPASRNATRCADPPAYPRRAESPDRRRPAASPRCDINSDARAGVAVEREQRVAMLDAEADRMAALPLVKRRDDRCAAVERARDRFDRRWWRCAACRRARRSSLRRRRWPRRRRRGSRPCRVRRPARTRRRSRRRSAAARGRPNPAAPRPARACTTRSSRCAASCATGVPSGICASSLLCRPSGSKREPKPAASNTPVASEA